MPLEIDFEIDPRQLRPQIDRLWEASAAKILQIEKVWRSARGTPVFTVQGRYTTRGWTEWTQGFQFGSALLQFDATGEKRFLSLGRRQTIERMPTHISHVGVHDHGFNTISTYGNWLRLLREGRISDRPGDAALCDLALRVSGAIQAARWTTLADGTGFIHSFNGAHSLFVDTMRSGRVLAVAHQLGHVLMGEQDRRISLLQRLMEHSLNTARYNIYYGKGRDTYDVRGRTAHEAIFNVASGTFRCPNSQQGYSAFTTWTRGLAWALLGFAEQLEFLDTVPRAEFASLEGAGRLLASMLAAARATADFYVASSCADGIPMWDTGAPGLHQLPEDYLQRRANPFNAYEPVDSSAAAIAAQGLIRLGNHLAIHRNQSLARRYRQAGLTVAKTLLEPPYLSTDAKHHGLLLHSVYHRPNGWDFVAPGEAIPHGESSMWGDYHLRELSLLILREIKGLPYLTFFGCAPPASRAGRRRPKAKANH